jgi:hypothetical protein
MSPYKGAAQSYLKAAIIPVAQLEAEDRALMWQLMQTYYEAVTEQQFLADLARKSSVIVLRDRGEGRLRGFSTLVRVHIRLDNHSLCGIFSGDTVIEQAYWGQRVLGKAFLCYLLREKLKHPWQSLYWLLISKGYKTYLLMANNFAEHYPRFERPTPPHIQRIMDAFYTALYPRHYNAHSGLVSTSGESCRLRDGVAGIAPSLLQANPRVAFFQRRNPTWQQGSELACMACMTVFVPCRYALKGMLRRRSG